MLKKTGLVQQKRLSTSTLNMCLSLKRIERKTTCARINTLFFKVISGCLYELSLD